MTVDVQGRVEPGFERVRLAFAQNFEQHGEVGAAFAAHVHGRPVVDIWSGIADIGVGTPWREDTEVAELREIDIGLMPLPDDEWAKGKCGLKALQFMSLELPVVTSPVGVNTKIISDGANGFLATSDDEWFDRLAALIESAELRATIGAAARATVVERYSVASQRETYLRLLTELTSS